MTITVHWLGGWASSLACWEPMLRARFPEFEHRFLETHALLDKHPAKMGLPYGGGTGGDVVAAWSMGSLLAHRWMEHGLWPVDVPLLSLCPIFCFLRPGGFGEPVLVRMEKKLATDREAVFRDFWRRMPKAERIPCEWEEKWMTAVRNYSDVDLISGLEFFRNTVIDPSALRSVPRRWELLIGDGDLLAPGQDAERLPPEAMRTIYAGGHLPFWECPDEIHSSLRRLALP